MAPHMEEITLAAAIRRYFDVVLWPRLAALAGPDLPRPDERRWPTRRGPSLRAIEGLVARIEERP